MLCAILRTVFSVGGGRQQKKEPPIGLDTKGPDFQLLPVPQKIAKAQKKVTLPRIIYLYYIYTYI